MKMGLTKRDRLGIDVVSKAKVKGQSVLMVQIENVNKAKMFVGVDFEKYIKEIEAADMSKQSYFYTEISDPEPGRYYISIYSESVCTVKAETYVGAIVSLCPNYCSDHGKCSIRYGFCNCQDGFADEDCSLMVDSMWLGQIQNGFVYNQTWNWYFFNVSEKLNATTHTIFAEFQLNRTSGHKRGDPSMYLRLGQPPTTHDFTDLVSTSSEFFNASVVKKVKRGEIWYVGIHIIKKGDARYNFGIKEVEEPVFLARTTAFDIIIGILGVLLGAFLVAGAIFGYMYWKVRKPRTMEDSGLTSLDDEPDDYFTGGSEMETKSFLNDFDD